MNAVDAVETGAKALIQFQMDELYQLLCDVVVKHDLGFDVLNDIHAVLKTGEITWE